MRPSKTARPLEHSDAPSPRRAGRILGHLLLAALFIGGAVVGLRSVRAYVARLTTPPLAVRLVLRNRPVWMSDRVAEQIVRSVRPAGHSSALDAKALEDVVANLKANAWIREVRQVRRVYGQQPGDTIEIDCEYRAPAALVVSGGEYWMVDGQGVRLPEHFAEADVPDVMFGRDRHMGQVQIRVIEGVSAWPPKSPGQTWEGDDLQAGLDLAKLLRSHGGEAANQVWRVRVSNFGGRLNRNEAHLVLITRYKTEIRWGEPVRCKFYAEVDPGEKLRRLADIVRDYKRIDAGHSWIDIRFDTIGYLASESPGQAHGS